MTLEKDCMFVLRGGEIASQNKTNIFVRRAWALTF
jgi:hypothetical protein